MVAGDIMAHLPKSPRGYEYLLVFVDLFSRWIECAPIRKTNAQTIRKELSERVFLPFGLPEVFHSDNGTEFNNKALDTFLEESGVTYTTIPPYHTQPNLLMRVNRTIKTMITSYLENNQRDATSCARLAPSLSRPVPGCRQIGGPRRFPPRVSSEGARIRRRIPAKSCGREGGPSRLARRARPSSGPTRVGQYSGSGESELYDSSYRCVDASAGQHPYRST